MSKHPALQAGNVAVVTGAADGIGLAAAHLFTGLGMKVCLADIRADSLAAAAEALPEAVLFEVDVSDRTAVEGMRDNVFQTQGRVDVLMNNAGIGRPSSSWTEYDNWQAVLNTNLWGVINGQQAFLPAMLEQKSAGLVINTGSKQGITSPPGNPAYNASKAAVKSITEALQHELRNTENCLLSAHLLVPGFTYTGMIRQFIAEQPAASWSPSQVVKFMLESVERGDFYILCPDNDVDRQTDNRRMAWAMNDLIENRPPLSRWHPDYLEAFEAFLKQ